MKKLIAFTFLSFLLLSCSKDEDQGEFNQIKIINHESDEEAILYCDYKGGKLTTISKYDTNNFLTGKTSYGYYSNGLPSGIVNYEADGSMINYITYTYDDERLMFKKYEGKYIREGYTISYAYNPDNTITATRMGTDPSTKTYYLNSDGLIYKEVAETSQYEVSFDGLNPISANNGVSVTTFEYNTVNNPDLLNNKNKDDHYIANHVLRANSLADAASNSANLYLIKQITSSILENIIYSYDYTFNGNGFPTHQKIYKNGSLTTEMEYIYQ